MRYLAVSIIIFLASLFTSQNGRTQIIADSHVFVGLEFKLTEIFGKYDKSEAIIGGRGGLIINEKYIIGAAAYKLGSKRNFVYMIDQSFFTRAQVNISYGGLLLGYTAKIGKFESLSVESLFGAGKISFANNPYITGNHSDLFLLAEPGVNFIIDFSRYSRIAIGVSYLLPGNIDFYNWKEPDFKGATYRIILEFGKF